MAASSPKKRPPSPEARAAAAKAQSVPPNGAAAADPPPPSEDGGEARGVVTIPAAAFPLDGRVLPAACALAGAAGFAASLWYGRGWRASLSVGVAVAGACGVLSSPLLLWGLAPPTAPEKEAAGRDSELERLLAAVHDRDAELPTGVALLESFRKEEAFNSFMPQKGPTCAAASVAGALNVVFNGGKERTFRVSEGMNVYKTVFEGKRDEMLEKLHKIVRVDPSPLVRLLFSSQFVCVAARSKDKGKFATLLPDTIREASSRSDLEQGDADALSALLAAATTEGPSAALAVERARALAKAQWAVCKLDGAWPLPSGKVLPSTAPVGNDRIVLCCKALALLKQGKPVRCTSFMGLRAPCRHIVSRKDSEEQREEQWGALREAVERPGAALIFHLHNHYALIFGWRVLHTAQHGKRRQVLTARVGQEPAHWVDWEGDFAWHSESKGKDLQRKGVLGSLYGWVGHKVMLVEAPAFNSKLAAPDPAVARLVDRARARAERVGPEDDEGDGLGVDYRGEEADGDGDAGGSGEEPES